MDFKDFLHQRKLPLWGKGHPNVKEVRSLCYKKNRSYITYKSYLEATPPEIAANTMVCLIHQANYLLDKQLLSLEKGFLIEGSFTERLYRTLSQMHDRNKNK